MSNGLRILVIAIAITASVALDGLLAGCGQKGPLFLPTEPAAANRASLPQTLLRTGNGNPTDTTLPAPAAKH